MDKKTINPLKILSIWFGIILVLTFLWWCFVPQYGFCSAVEFFLLLIFCSLGFFIVFWPLIYVLYFLFKKIKNKCLRILLVSFLIPFTNLIYLFIEHFCFNSDFISNIIGFSSLFCTIPLCFITALCTPKFILPIKWEIIITTVLTAIFGIGLIMLSDIIIPKIDDIVAKSKLEKYEVIINNLEDYKKQNKVYPQKIEDNVQVFKQLYYNTKNSDTDYILTVGDGYFIQYNYCSTEQLDGCYSKKTDYASYEKYGKWIKVVEYD